MLRKVTYSIAFALILLTPFLYSDELYNGVVTAKQFWFYGAMAFLMLVTALDLLFDRKPFILQFNKIDLALLAFYTYYTIRATTTPYMPLLHNQRWINWTLCIILYFVIRRVTKIWSLGSHSSTLNSHLLSLVHSLFRRTTNAAKQMTTNDIFYNAAQPVTINDSAANDKPFSNAAQQMSTNDNTTNDESRSNDDHRPNGLHFFIVNFLILTALVQSIWGLLQLYGYLPSFNSNFKITGTFFNPAPYAMYLAVIFPMAFGKIIKNEQLRINNIQKPKGGIFTYIKFSFQFLIINSSLLIHYLSFATVIAILLVLPATMIRAAWLAAAFGALVVAWPWLKQHTRLGSWLFPDSDRDGNLKYKIAAVTVIVAVIGVIGTGLFYLKKDSANGKLFIWEVTLGKIAEKPLLGYGVGRFEAEYNNWQAEYFQKHPAEMNGPKGWVAGNTKYCFNEFLENTSETGIIGILLFGSLLVLTLGGMNLSMKELKIKHERQPDSSILNSSFLILNNLSPSFLHSFILSFLILSFFSFPFYNLPLLLIFIAILAVISGNKLTKVIPLKPTFIPQYSFATILLTLSAWVGFALVKNNAANKTWQIAGTMYSGSVYDVAEKEYEEAYESFKYNNEFLQQYGKCLAINKSFSKALKKLNEATNFGGDYMLYANLGDVYKGLKLYSKAEVAYKYSGFIVPHKLYPHYLLAKLYIQSGDTLKATNEAKEILAMNAKVNNRAEEEIKQEMKRILKKEENY